MKVITCEEPVTLGTRQKQEVKVCDSTRWGVCAAMGREHRIAETRMQLQTESFELEYEIHLGSEAQPIKKTNSSFSHQFNCS